jgi:hypothetical protein
VPATATGGALAQTGKHSKELRVPKKLKVNHVTGLQGDEARQRIVVTTDRSGSLWLDTSTLDRYSQTKIAAARADKGPIVLEFDAQNGEIKGAFMPIIDPIVYLSGPDEDREVVRVTAMKRPTQLVLHKDNPEFETLYSILAKAFAQHRDGWEAAIAVPRGSESIADVILVPPVRQD